MSRMAAAILATCSLFSGLTASVSVAQATKDQSRLGAGGKSVLDTPKPGSPNGGLFSPQPKLDPGRDPGLDPNLEPGSGNNGSFGGVHPEEIPDIESVELTEDGARRSLDAFAVVRNKYDDEGIERFETLEAFVEQTDAGKRLASDIASYGFDNVTEWNRIIMTVGFAYGTVVEQQEPEIRLQIEEIKSDTSLDQKSRDRIVASLNALIPSKNNRAIINKLMQEENYAAKLEMLLEE